MGPVQNKRPTRTKKGYCEYLGWEIEACGGFCTVRHWYAQKGNKKFHQFRFGELLDMIEQLEAGTLTFEDIHPVFKKPAYL